jgi:hypothetical protein
VHVFRNVLLWWRRLARRTRAMVVLDAAPDPFPPLLLPALRRSVPGNAGWGSRAGVALCTTPAPSMRDVIDRYAPLLFGMQAARVPAPTAQMASPKNWRNFGCQAVSHLSIITCEVNQKTKVK